MKDGSAIVVDRLTRTFRRQTAVDHVSFEVARGTMIAVEEESGAFRARAEVSSVSIDADGRPSVVLRFVDGSVPDRLLRGKRSLPEA